MGILKIAGRTPTELRMRNVVLIVLALVVGCGVQSARESARTSAESAPAATTTDTPESSLGFASRAVGGQADKDGGAVPSAQRLQRKIIYTADVELVVENFSDLPTRVEELVRQNGGYVASSNLSGSAGDRRSGTWKVRIPVEGFNAFVDAVRKLGEVRRIGTNSQDVSEEFYDVEARIRNRKREEEQLLKLLAERTGELDDVLAVERELSRVREEVERLEGRLRVLQDLTALTTVTLTIEEVKNYVPIEAATLGTRIRRTFAGSLDSLRRAGEGLLIFLVAALPWIAVLGLPVLLIAVTVRRKLGRKRAGTAAA
jgi:hypothetical protein